MSNPFHRAQLAMMAIASILAQVPPGILRDTMLRELQPYRSRGKGRGTAPRRFGNKPGKYTPHEGAREVARRKQQIERGILRVSA